MNYGAAKFGSFLLTISESAIADAVMYFSPLPFLVLFMLLVTREKKNWWMITSCISLAIVELVYITPMGTRVVWTEGNKSIEQVGHKFHLMENETGKISNKGTFNCLAIMKREECVNESLKYFKSNGLVDVAKEDGSLEIKEKDRMIKNKT